MGNIFSSLRRKFNRRRARSSAAGGPNRGAGAAYLYDGVLQEVTEKSLLEDASKLTIRTRRVRRKDQFWKSPHERLAHIQPVIYKTAFAGDFGIGEITNLCQRFQGDDSDSFSSDESLTLEERLETLGVGAKDETDCRASQEPKSGDLHEWGISEKEGDPPEQDWCLPEEEGDPPEQLGSLRERENDFLEQEGSSPKQEWDLSERERDYRERERGYRERERELPEQEEISRPPTPDIDIDDEVHSFPDFVTPFLNKDVRIRLQFNKAVKSTFNPTYNATEPVHLWRNLKYIDGRFLCHPLQNRVKIMLEESHGSQRRGGGMIRRSRPLFPRAIIFNSANQATGLYVAGKEFTLLLAPPPGGAHRMEDGLVLYAVGTYIRYLDTDPNFLMVWRARILEECEPI